MRIIKVPLTIVAGVIFFSLSFHSSLANVETAPNEVWKKSKASIQSDGYTQNKEYADDHILVKYYDQDVQTVSIKSNQSITDAISEWKTNPDVEYVEPDGLVRAYSQITSWGWSTVHASEAASENGATGSGIIVAVIDTGVDYLHEDLDANNWVNSGETASDGIDNDGNGYVDDVYGYDFIGSFYTSIAEDNDPQDENGHGTHVAGIIAAENNSLGVRGVAPSATIMPVKALDAVGIGFDSTIADGIHYAVDNGANIINMSLGSSMASNTIREAVQYAESNGVLVIAAAGNNNSFTMPSYPAAYEEVVSVAASNEDGYITDYSNFGKIDVIAPGDDIISTTPGDTYDRFSGTSMASPHVAGVAALIEQDSGTTDPIIVRNILESTTSDFGTQTGPDYVSGQGMVDAQVATGTLSASASLYTDSNYIISDGSDSIVATLTVRAANGSAISGDTVTWSTTKGTLSATTSTTDSNGQTTVSITADDTSGLALVTATPASVSAASLQFSILSDIPDPINIGIAQYSSDSSEEYMIEGGGEENDEMDVAMNAVPVYSAGDRVTIWSYPYIHDKQNHKKVMMTYTVTDPTGATVTALSGTTTKKSIGELWWIWFSPQNLLSTKPLTIPIEAKNGRYKLTVTVTDTITSESSSRSTSFWVGKQPDILIVDNDDCADTPVEGLSYGGMPACSNAGHILAKELRDLNFDALLWSTSNMNTTPGSDVLNQFSVVIWADAGLMYTDTSALQEYLEAGGNLLLTTDILATNESGYGGSPSSFLWDYLHVKQVSQLIQPDVVTGTSNGPFSGIEFNTDYFDLNGDGAHNNFFSDELEINDGNNAIPILQYSVGDSDEKTAGIRVNTGTYRLVYLGFSLEAINDVSGNATKGHVLNTLITWLQSGSPIISKVNHNKITNNKTNSITIYGKHFDKVGTTIVKLGKHQLQNVRVINRTTIKAEIPEGLNQQYYSLSITNPDGKKVTKAKAIKINIGGPRVTSFSRKFIPNHRVNSVRIQGNKFTNNSKVYLNSILLTDVTVVNSGQIKVNIPATLNPGHYVLRVVNTTGRKGVSKTSLIIRYGFDLNLHSGDNTDAVLYLEERLSRYQFFSQEPDRVFDMNTANALRRYQKNWDLPITGKLDYLTRYTLNTNQ